jgi:FrmR/RcnR family transcriptional regulator, repressor of frmRAB operon
LNINSQRREREGYALLKDVRGQEVILSVSPITGNDCAEILRTWEGRVLDTTREKSKLVNRVRRIRGQIEAVERALEREIGCSDMLRIITSARGAINGLMAEVIEDYVRMRVADPLREPDVERALAAEELIDIVHSYLK